MLKIKPPPSPEQRRDHRVEVYASVEVTLGGDLLILAVKNISLGGIFLLSDGDDLLPVLPVGGVHQLLLFDAADEASPSLGAAARVVRHEKAGVGMTWTRHVAGLAELIDRLPKK